MSGVSAELVRHAYLLLLGREPESEQVVRDAQGHQSVASLRQAFMASTEFQNFLSTSGLGRVPLDAPQMEIELEIDPAVQGRLLAHVQKSWTRLGEIEPHWSVLTMERFRSDNISASAAEFYQSGHATRDLVLAVLRRNGVDPVDIGTALEYGCGVGRVTLHLAECFAKVIGTDISAKHLHHAQAVLRQHGIGNVECRHVDCSDFGMREPIGLWFSTIVLQHNPPPIIGMILRRAFTMLAPGGVAIFQVPTYAIGYSFRLADYVAGMQASEGMEMHVMPQHAIMEIAAACGCQLLEMREDGWVGSKDWVSNMFVFRKSGAACALVPAST